MKITFAFLLLVVVSCETHNREVFIKITSIDFSAATTQTSDGNPQQTTEPITAHFFAIRIDYDFEMSGPGDPFEDEVRVPNPIDTFQVWSPQTVSGRIPFSSLNTLFKHRISPSNVVALQENGPLKFNTIPQSLEEPLPKTAYLLTASETSISPGIYDFYFRCKLHDGTVMLDSLINISIN